MQDLCHERHYRQLKQQPQVPAQSHRSHKAVGRWGLRITFLPLMVNSLHDPTYYSIEYQNLWDIGYWYIRSLRITIPSSISRSYDPSKIPLHRKHPEPVAKSSTEKLRRKTLRACRPLETVPTQIPISKIKAQTLERTTPNGGLFCDCPYNKSPTIWRLY